MEFYEKVAGLSARSKTAERQALTEEATKTAVILPFLQLLGFDVFNLDEVVPEFIADVGVKKGEKVDFVVKIDGQIAMLIEAKPISSKLGSTQYSQLFRYFSVTESRLAILTNGREAWFFSDTDEPNKMDKKPFFTFDFQDHDKAQIAELARFCKDSFAIDNIIEAASNLKYVRNAANYLKRQMASPDEDFLRLVGRNIHEGSVTKTVMEQLRPAVQSALDELVRDRIQDKLSITLRPETQAPVALESAVDPSDAEIETTTEELEGFHIVRAIASKHVPVERVSIRDAKSYCAILMDNNNRKPVCRLYFNSAKTKYVGVIDGEKNETKFPVEKPSDIYRHIDAIETAIRAYG